MPLHLLPTLFCPWVLGPSGAEQLKKSEALILCTGMYFFAKEKPVSRFTLFYSMKLSGLLTIFLPKEFERKEKALAPTSSKVFDCYNPWNMYLFAKLLFFFFHL